MAKIKKTRQLKKPNKKWEKQEVFKMLQYIQKEGNLEKPTAQIYYRKLLEETKIDTTWDLMRWKMRNLRQNFEKALECKNKIRAGITDEGIEMNNIEVKLNQLCPFFNILFDIFGEKYNKNFEFHDTGLDVLSKNSISNIDDVGEMVKVEMVTTNSEDSFNMEEYVTQVNDRPLTLAYSNNKNDEPKVKLKKRVSKTFLQQLNIINRERNELLKLKIEAENIYNERKICLEELKFEEEKKRKQEEFELRKQELQLKKLELERDERLKMYEIKMKYGNKD